MTTRPGKSWWKWCNRRARKPNDEIWHTIDTAGVPKTRTKLHFSSDSQSVDWCSGTLP
jgi:hypothetical protein